MGSDEGHGDASAGGGLHVQGGHLLSSDAAAEGAGGRPRQAQQEVNHAGDRRRRKRRQHDQKSVQCFAVCKPELRWLFMLIVFAFSRSHRRGHQRAGGPASRALERLLNCAVPLPRAAAARARALVVPAHVQVPQVLLLQELRLHALPLLVRLLLRLLCSGSSFSLRKFFQYMGYVIGQNAIRR